MYVRMYVFVYVFNFMYVFWIPWHRLEGSCEIGSVHPSSVLLSRRFLGMVSLVFSKFWHVLESHIMLCWTESDFNKKKFAPKKFFLLNLCCNENFHKCHIWENFWFLRYGPKCSQPIRLQDFLNNHISR